MDMNYVNKILLDKEIYPLEAILNTCYVFIDRVYVFLDSDSSSRKIIVNFKSKQKVSLRKVECLKGEFMNELLHNALRYLISKNSKKIRECIIGHALCSAGSDLNLIYGRDNINEKLDYLDDPLGIAIPWEEKYGKKKNKAVKV